MCCLRWLQILDSFGSLLAGFRAENDHQRQEQYQR